MTQIVMEGSCLCGNIRFSVTGKPLNPHTCSCKMCQRHSGAPTLSWVEYSKKNVKWIGKGGAPTTFRSSKFSSRAFCHICGSSLGAIDDKPTVALLTGVFDAKHQNKLRPTKHSFVDLRPDWWSVAIND